MVTNIKEPESRYGGEGGGEKLASQSPQNGTPALAASDSDWLVDLASRISSPDLMRLRD